MPDRLPRNLRRCVGAHRLARMDAATALASVADACSDDEALDRAWHAHALGATWGQCRTALDEWAEQQREDAR